MTVGCVVVLLRALLPIFLQRYVNRVLDRSEDYEGSVGDVDVALFRGAYTIEAVEIHKRNGRVPVPEIFQDQKNDRVATRIPLSGTVQDPKLGFWPTLGNVVRNAFIESFQPRLDQSVGGK